MFQKTLLLTFTLFSIACSPSGNSQTANPENSKAAESATKILQIKKALPRGSIFMGSSEASTDPDNTVIIGPSGERWHLLATSAEIAYLTVNFKDVFLAAKTKDTAEAQKEVTKYVNDRVDWINQTFGRKEAQFSESSVWNYFWNRKWLPMRVSNALIDESESTHYYDTLQQRSGELKQKGIGTVSRWVRAYPQDKMAAHILGRMKNSSPSSWKRDEPITADDFETPPQLAGTGIDQSFDELLNNNRSQKVERTFKMDGTPIGEEKKLEGPGPAPSMVLTLDYDLQKLVEEIVEDRFVVGKNKVLKVDGAYGRPKAFVLIDLRDMTVAAMASAPTFEPQRLSPNLPNENYLEELQKDPEHPLDSRAFETSYPPASTFKLVMALAGLESYTISPSTTYPCTPYVMYGNKPFKNHCDEKKELGLAYDPLYTFKDAIKRSCNTWFYQMGQDLIRNPSGFRKLSELTRVLGLGRDPKEEKLFLPGMVKGTMFEKLVTLLDDQGARRGPFPGEVANMSIGQGDLEATPLQVARMAAKLAMPHSKKRLSLVRSIYDQENKRMIPFEAYLNMKNDTLEKDEALIDHLNTRDGLYNLRLVQESMYSVVNGYNGTAARAKSNLKYTPSIAAKTGTGQWKSATKQNVAWLTGYFPFQAPLYAFAVLVEGAPHYDVSGGKTAAPLLNALLSRDLIQKRIEAHIDVSAQTALRPLPILDERPAPQPVMRAIPVDPEYDSRLDENSPYVQPYQRPPQPKKPGILQRIFSRGR